MRDRARDEERAAEPAEERHENVRQSVYPSPLGDRLAAGNCALTRFLRESSEPARGAMPSQTGTAVIARSARGAPVDAPGRSTSADLGRVLARAVSDRRAADQIVVRAGERMIARSDPVPAAPVTPAAPAAPTGDVLQDALAELRASSELIDRNTAQAIDNGALSVRYLDDIAIDPDSDALLDGWGFDKTQYAVRLCPNGERRVIQRNAVGSAHHDCGTSWLFVAKTLTVSGMRETLVHETNHALRLDEGSATSADSFNRYKDEFQAYWVESYRTVADLDDRARQIRAHVLREYPALAARHRTDTAFAALVDGHTRPDGNVLNSLRWRAIEDAIDGLGTDEDGLFAAIRAMSPEERAAAGANADLMGRVRGDLSGEDLARAELLMAGATAHSEAALNAMSGMGTDEDGLFAALSAMDPAERALVRGNAAFMARLHDDLSGAELARALALVGATP